MTQVWQQGKKQLALQASSLQSDVKRELFGTRQEVLLELKNFAKKEEEDRQSWEQDLWSELSKLRKQLSGLGSNVRIAGPEELRKMVGSMEHKLKVYSEQRRLELQELCADECRLEESLQASLARFEAWNSDASATPGKAPRVRPRSAPQRRQGVAARSDLRERVTEISQQLATPRDGGWRQADHDAFLRLLLGRFRGRPSGTFLAEAQELLPHVAHEQLVEHAKWLLEQDALQTERQSLLQQWRKEKTTKGEERAERVSLASEVAKESAQKREAEMKKRQSIAEKKKQVEAWQKARAEAARAEQERQREVEEEERRKAKRRQEALQAKKEEMEHWRQQKDMLRKNEAGAAQVTCSPLSPEQLVRLRARSEQLLRNRERQRAEKLASCAREELVRSEAYSHIPGRLDSSTQEYVLRARQCRDDDSEAWSCRGVMPGNFAHQGLLRTMRAAPAWRNQCL